VLTVPVEPDHRVVAALQGVQEGGLHRSADPEVARQVHDHRPGRGAAASDVPSGEPSLTTRTS
jgi:hypothetical protein